MAPTANGWHGGSEFVASEGSLPLLGEDETGSEVSLTILSSSTAQCYFQSQDMSLPGREPCNLSYADFRRTN